MPRTSNELTNLTLVASDMSYAAGDPGYGFVGSALQVYPETPHYNQIPLPFSIPSGYVVDRVFEDSNTTRTGFKAIAFRGQSDVIIAFAGTDGSNRAPFSGLGPPGDDVDGSAGRSRPVGDGTAAGQNLYALD